MKNKKIKNAITLEDLAVMVAKGFESAVNKEDFKKINNKVEKLDSKVEKIDNKVENLSDKVEAYNSNVKNYLALSEKRYFELKQRDALLAEWIKLVAAKAKIPIDVSQLEKI